MRIISGQEVYASFRNIPREGNNYQSSHKNSPQMHKAKSEFLKLMLRLFFYMPNSLGITTYEAVSGINTIQLRMGRQLWGF